jgi:CheY-like chemotaxis protein
MSAKQYEKPPVKTGAVLIADDNQDDVKLLRRDLQQMGITQVVHDVPDGEQVIAYLQGAGAYNDREKFPYPILLILDLRMKPIDGFAVLRWLKAHPQLATFPILLLTASTERTERTEAYRLGATTFLTKPTTQAALKQTIQALNVLLHELD